MRDVGRLVVAVLFVVTVAAPLAAQGTAPPRQPPLGAAQPAPPPATKLEGFKPAAGSVTTLGYDELGTASYGVSVDARELVDAKGAGARGLVVEVTESQYRKEKSFVDADEIPELLKAVDALLEVKDNPTQFKNFEVQYTTKGDLKLVAFNNSKGKLSYAVQAGRTLSAKSFLDGPDMLKLRELFVAALQKLNATGFKHPLGWWIFRCFSNCRYRIEREPIKALSERDVGFAIATYFSGAFIWAAAGTALVARIRVRIWRTSLCRRPSQESYRRIAPKRNGCRHLA